MPAGGRLVRATGTRKWRAGRASSSSMDPGRRFLVGVGRQDRAHAGGDFSWAEGLGHVLVRAAEETAFTVALLTACAQHDHVRVGERSILPDLFADLIA